MDSPTAGATSPTYQCVVCQSTCLTPSELHRHQSYRHTPEELSLSIMGVHNAAIRTFDRPNGIVYDNSWLYDPSRHAEFYTYSANMLCDDNNNGGVVNYAFKTFKDTVVQDSGPVAVPDKEDFTVDLDRCIDEKYENENFAEPRNFEQESYVVESKILDLRLKIDLEVETETRMDTARDDFWGCGEGSIRDAENLGTEGSKSASLETCMKSLNFEKLQTCIPDGLASKILDLGQRVFSEIRADSAADDFGNRYEGSQPCSASGNHGRDIEEKAKKQKIETCVKVQNSDKPETCVQDFEILDLSQKFYSGVHSETRMDTETEIFGGNLEEETGKSRSFPSECPAKSKVRKLTTPRKKLHSPKRGAAKLENTNNGDNGNIDSAKAQSQDLQDSLSWFKTEPLKIQKFNDRIKQIWAAQKKALDLTKGTRKQVKGQGSRKAKKRPMQSCERKDADRWSNNFDSGDLLGFDGKGATINAICSRNPKRPRVARKKEKICQTEADKTAELPKKPLDEKTAAETGITQICAKHSLTVRSDQALVNFKSQISKIHPLNAETTKKPRVSKKKGKISEIEVNNLADLQKKQHKEERPGGTDIIVHSAEHSSIADSEQSLFSCESNRSKIRVTTSGNVKKPRVSKKKATISKTDTDNFSDLQKKQHEKETAGETAIALNSAEHCAVIGSDRSFVDSESSKPKIHAKTSGNAKKPRVSKKKGKIGDNSAEETAELLKKLLEEETAGETRITENQENENGNRPERSAIFASAESTFDFASNESNIDMVSSVNDIETTANGADQNCAKEADLQPNWDFESQDFLPCSDGDGQKINAMDVENIGAQAKKTAVNKPPKHESIEATENVANQNCANKADLQPNWDFESQDFRACSVGDGQKINTMDVENAGAQSENAALEVTGKVLRDLLTKHSEEETLRGTVKLENQDYENGNCAEQSSIFGSAESTVRFESKEAKIDDFASGSAKKPVASKTKPRNPKTVTDKPRRENTKIANQNFAKEVVLRPNWDFESPHFLACLDGAGQNLNATCAEKAKTGAENAAVEVSAELLRDLLTEPSEEETPRVTEELQNEDCGNEAYAEHDSFYSSDEYLYYFPSDEAKMAAMSSGYVKNPIASRKKSIDPKTVTVWPAKQKITRKIVNDGNGNSSKQSSGSSRDVFSYAGSESEETTITPLSKFRAERSSALGNKPKKINTGVEYCPGYNSNFVPNIYTCMDSASKQVKMEAPGAGKPKKRQLRNKKSTNSEVVSDKVVVKKTARGITKKCYQDFGSEMFVSQNSPPIIDVNSSTESVSQEEMPQKSPAGNFGKSIVARNKPNNLKTPQVEPALRKNSEKQEHDNVISLYKDSSPIPGRSSGCDNELSPVTFVAYPPYVDENSILVLNPESRELVWKCLEPEDSRLDQTAIFHWADAVSHQNFSDTGKATTSRNVDGKKSASFVPAAIGASAANEESTLQKTNVIRRSTRPRKVIQRYNS